MALTKIKPSGIASTFSTNAIAEGTNQYFTNAKVTAALVGTAVSVGRLTVTGNLSVYGDISTYGANNLSISDNMIYLNSNATTSNPDLGIAGNYNDGVYAHAGFFRDATDGVWKVFDNYQPEPDASPFIDTSNVSFRLANIQATTFYGNVVGAVTVTHQDISKVTLSPFLLAGMG